jgi:hypothetical protein
LSLLGKFRSKSRAVSFIGKMRASPFLVSGRVIIPFSRSMFSQRRLNCSERLNPVLSAKLIAG